MLLSSCATESVGCLQVNALSEWIIWIYLHEFFVSERVQVNTDNSRAMSALTFLLFKSSDFESAEAMV